MEPYENQIRLPSATKDRRHSNASTPQQASPACIVDRYLADQMSLNAFEQLEITFRQIMRCSSLERHHGDPFDRLLVAQAQEESLPIVSRDPAFDAYGIKRIW
jgi:PIN domain nuclease of toxin-antitoxin system